MMCSADPSYVSQDLAWNRPVLAVPSESREQPQGIPAWAWIVAAVLVVLGLSGGEEKRK